MVSLSFKLPLSSSKTKFAQYQRNISLIKISSNPDVKSFLLRTSDFKLYLSSKNYKNQNKFLSIINLKEREKMMKEEEVEMDGMRENIETREGERIKQKEEKEMEKVEEEKKKNEKNGKSQRKKWMNEEQHGKKRREEEGKEIRKEENLKREEEVWKSKREEVGKRRGKQEEVRWENCKNYFYTSGMSELNATKKDDISGKSFYILRKVNLNYNQHQSSLFSEKNEEEVERRRTNEEEEGRRYENDDNKNAKRTTRIGRGREKDERREEKGEKVVEKWKEQEEGGVRKRIIRLRGYVGRRRKNNNTNSDYFRELKGKKLSFQNEEDRKELVDFFHADKGFEGKEESKSTMLPKIRSNNSFQKNENKAFFKTFRKAESSYSFFTNKSGGKREEGGGREGVGKKEAGLKKVGEGGKKEEGRREDDKSHIGSFEVKGEGVYDEEEDFLKYVNRIKFSD